MIAVVGFVEASDDQQLFIAAALLEDGAVRHVYRKSYLPNYGLFDERRFFAAGSQLRAVDSRLGVRLGLCICEDFWHLPVPLSAGARRRPDAGQHLVLARARRRRGRTRAAWARPSRGGR